jgi:hypothetical protein
MLLTVPSYVHVVAFVMGENVCRIIEYKIYYKTAHSGGNIGGNITHIKAFW